MARVQGSYGIDAPGVLLGLAGGGVALLVGAGVGAGVAGTAGWRLVPLVACGVGGLSLIASAACFGHTTLRGKFLVWQDLLDGVGWAGDEQVLDLGCGRGAVLVAAAGRVPRGRAVGVDLWRTVDQSGNAPERTGRNADRAGVADRVELHTGDLTSLPFPDHSFDVVLSALTIHNIPDPAGRDQAVDEAVRVLRPGGRLVIADIQHTARYLARLSEHGVSGTRRALGWRYWYGGPWMPTYAVTATR